MRFESTFKVSPPQPFRLTMRPRIAVVSSECLQEVLEACAHLPLNGDPAALRDYVAETARRVFQASLAGILVRERESYVLESLGDAGNRVGSAAKNRELVSSARSCAIQAIHQQKLLEFRFSPSRSEDQDYHGLAQSLQNGPAPTALLMA